MMAIYLDYNASAPIDERVLDRMIEIYRSHYGNADSRTHIFGTDVKEIVSSSRRLRKLKVFRNQLLYLPKISVNNRGALIFFTIEKRVVIDNIITN